MSLQWEYIKAISIIFISLVLSLNRKDNRDWDQKDYFIQSFQEEENLIYCLIIIVVVIYFIQNVWLEEEMILITLTLLIIIVKFNDLS